MSNERFTTYTLSLSLSGVAVFITSEFESIIKSASFDFALSVNPTPTKHYDISVTIRQSTPENLTRFGDEKGRITSGVKYSGITSEDEELIEYANGTACIWTRANNTADFWGKDEKSIYEKIYLFILSRTGELLEKRNIFRVHGFAIELNGAAVLGMAPSGGGKSTLGFELIQNKDIRLISDDAPLVFNEHNTIALQSLPLRLGFKDKNTLHSIASESLRVFTRDGRSEKFLLTPTASIVKWCHTPTPLRVVISLQFTKNKESRIEPLSKLALLRLLTRDLVIGYGLPQVVEFFLKNGIFSLIGKMPLIVSRFIITFKILFQTQGFVFFQNADTKNNSIILLEHIKKVLNQ